ncbi:MAG TPA: ABC transporter ATP-binding protein [Vicinamibacterales bacterium]|nr:ABC transporter ATP-binding protein [Vicinamibacterales bacterium]
MEAILTEGLTKHYKVGFWRPRPYLALDALSLRVNEGEVFGFLGPNGAGKTTTLKLLMQLIYPTSGRAEILGRPIGDPAVRRRIGYLPENPYFYDYLTAEELLEYFAGLFGYEKRERRRRAARLLDDVGIGAERRLQLRKFSKGMLQRVGIAQALVNDPSVVFFDEPMSGLDPLGRRAIRELILALRDKGCTVFFSSHVLSDAEALCSRVAILAAGRLVAEGALSELLAFRVRGWELVVAGLTPAALERVGHGGRVAQATPLGAERFALQLTLAIPPEQIVSELVHHGAQIVSLNPIRDTLEDLFVRRVTDAPVARGLDLEAVPSTDRRVRS